MRVKAVFEAPDEAGWAEICRALRESGCSLLRVEQAREIRREDFPLTGGRLRVYNAIPTDGYVTPAQIAERTGVAAGTAVGRCSELERVLGLIVRRKRDGRVEYRRLP